MGVGRGFSSIADGIYNPTQCSNGGHGVVIVGYGFDEKRSLDYWIVRNSYGESFGNFGYLRVARGKNMCGIGNWIYVPKNN